MRIVCPDCAATYDVPDGMLAAPRQVRCARCGGEWTPEQVAPEAAEDGSSGHPSLIERMDLAHPSGADPDAAVLDRPPAGAAFATVAGVGDAEAAGTEAVPTRRAAASARAAWAGSVLLLVVLAWAAYTWRGPIMQAWPPSERVYAALGLA